MRRRKSEVKKEDEKNEGSEFANRVTCGEKRGRVTFFRENLHLFFKREVTTGEHKKHEEKVNFLKSFL
eukprot:m.282086 g.282086  ORF g.282086 m.282086 type:complete len:68 (-) comp22898_c1_seq2:23-226(-)